MKKRFVDRSSTPYPGFPILLRYQYGVIEYGRKTAEGVRDWYFRTEDDAKFFLIGIMGSPDTHKAWCIEVEAYEIINAQEAVERDRSAAYSHGGSF